MARALVVASAAAALALTMGCTPKGGTSAPPSSAAAGGTSAGTGTGSGSGTGAGTGAGTATKSRLPTAFRRRREPPTATKVPAGTIKVLLLSDTRCRGRNCNRSYYERTLRRAFAPISVIRVDYSTPTGKRLFAKLKLKFLPAYLVTKRVEERTAWSRMSRSFTRRGRWWHLRTYSRWDPTAEICDNKIDDNGDGKIDCADKTCAKKLVCRKARPRRLDLFIMGHCMYARKVIPRLATILKRFGPQITLGVDYIVSGKHPNYRALFGPASLGAVRVQLCVQDEWRRMRKRKSKAWRKKTPSWRWFDYLVCRTANWRGRRWQPCARQLKLSVRRISRCASGKKSLALLKVSAKRRHEIKATGSPTLLVNNRYKLGGARSTQAIQKFICKYNKGIGPC